MATDTRFLDDVLVGEALAEMRLSCAVTLSGSE